MTVTKIPKAIRLDVKVVSFVRAFRGAYDRGPSLSEIMIGTEAGSKTTVSRAVVRLVTAGRLVRLANSGLTVPGDVEAAVTLLRGRGFRFFSDGAEMERNGNYAVPPSMGHLLDKLA